MMAERETETDAREEAWVIATNPDFPIRARNVNWFLERGGSIKEVRLTESETGEWSVWLRLAGRSVYGSPANGIAGATCALNRKPLLTVLKPFGMSAQ